MKMMMGKESQYHFEDEVSTMVKNDESICDKHDRSTDHSQKQMYHSNSQSRLMIISQGKKENHRCIEYCVESKLIEVMKMKMQTIQFVSIVNLIQMKLMKVSDMTKSLTSKEF
jgi:hypothetical protein